MGAWKQIWNIPFNHARRLVIIIYILTHCRFEGMFIPKGTRVVLNQWALHFDDVRFPDPWRFNPQRYVGTPAGDKSAFEALNAINPEERDHWGYGAGRRWCPGMMQRLSS